MYHMEPKKLLLVMKKTHSLIYPIYKSLKCYSVDFV